MQSVSCFTRIYYTALKMCWTDPDGKKMVLQHLAAAHTGHVWLLHVWQAMWRFLHRWININFRIESHIQYVSRREQRVQIENICRRKERRCFLLEGQALFHWETGLSKAMNKWPLCFSLRTSHDLLWPSKILLTCISKRAWTHSQGHWFNNNSNNMPTVSPLLSAAALKSFSLSPKWYTQFVNTTYKQMIVSIRPKWTNEVHANTSAQLLNMFCHF